MTGLLEVVNVLLGHVHIADTDTISVLKSYQSTGPGQQSLTEL